MNIQRLVQEVHRPALVALERVIEFTAGGADENDRDVFGFLGAAHQLGEFKAVHARHLYIEDGHGELVLQQQRKCFVRRQRLVHRAVLALDQRFEGQQVLRQIVDDQQFGLDITQHAIRSSSTSRRPMP